MSICYDTAWRVASLTGHLYTPAEVQSTLERSKHAFMAPEIIYLSDANQGAIGDEFGNTGWYWRLSASGYMDATDWEGPFDTEAHALASMLLLYGDDWSETE